MFLKILAYYAHYKYDIIFLLIMQCFWLPTGARQRIMQQGISDPRTLKVYPFIIISQAGKKLLTV